MLYSFIIPCYNVQDYIERSVDSIFSQTYENFEVILINDGSSDKTLEKLQSIKAKSKKSVTIIDHKDNLGVSYVRNRGIESANGDYIIFLDADDYVERDFLKVSNEILTRRSGVDIVSFAYDYIDADGKIVKKYENMRYDGRFFEGYEFLKLFLSKKINIHLCSMIFKKEFLRYNNLKFIDHISYGEDHIFQIDALLRAKKVFYNSYILYHYVYRADSLVNVDATSRKFEIFDESDRLREKIVDLPDDKVVKYYDNYMALRFFGLLKEGYRTNADKSYFANLIKHKKLLHRVSPIGVSIYSILGYLLSKLYLIYPTIIHKIAKISKDYKV
jgi:glycosyltransferase involved in cell wall biosynthesis